MAFGNLSDAESATTAEFASGRIHIVSPSVVAAI